MWKKDETENEERGCVLSTSRRTCTKYANDWNQSKLSIAVGGMVIWWMENRECEFALCCQRIVKL